MDESQVSTSNGAMLEAAQNGFKTGNIPFLFAEYLAVINSQYE